MPDTLMPHADPTAKPARWQWPAPSLLLLAALGGGMFALSFCGYDQDYLAWFCLAPALWGILDPRTRSVRQAAVIGWTTGLCAHLGVYHWLIDMLRDFGYLPLPLAVLGYVLVCWVQSALFATWGALSFHASRRWKLGPVFAAPALYILCEWLFPSLFPSFLANSQYRRIVLIQGCELYGVLGLSFLIALASSVSVAVLAWATHRNERFPAAGVGAIAIALAALLTFGFRSVARVDEAVARSDKRLRVGIVQANMGIYQKTEMPEEGLRRHRDQSMQCEQQGAELIVWPESAYYFALDPNITNVKPAVLGRLHTPLLFGGMRIAEGERGRELFNSAFLTDADGNIKGSYDKTHLLAFGEYLPLGEWLPILYQYSPQTSLFTRGRHVRPLEFKNMRIGTLICYEDILPSFVRRAMSDWPDVLINLTNDAWFGQSHEPRIHLALATFRAVEQRRFLVRATNTGISAIIDPTGRILQETPIFARANIVADVVGLTEGTLYQEVGDWPAMLAAAWLALAAGRAWLRRRAERKRGAAAGA